MNDWDGLGNEGGLTIADKIRARTDADLPEPVDKEIRLMFGVQDEVTLMWRAGLVDIAVIDNVVNLRMTKEQGRMWRRVKR